jgi:hypothetical protein
MQCTAPNYRWIQLTGADASLLAVDTGIQI